jgi:hypothetical protein
MSGGVIAKRFRADRYARIAIIDQLVRSRMILERDGAYFIGIRALDKLDSVVAKKLIPNIEKIFPVLREKYRRNPDEMVTLRELSDESALSRAEVVEAIAIMQEAPSWYGGGSTALASEDSYVVTAEGILGFNFFWESVELLRKWDRESPQQPFFGSSWPGDEQPQRLQNLRRREKPERLSELPDKLGQLLDEVYLSMDHGLNALPAMGLRAMVDMAAVDRFGDIGGFDRKLDQLKENGFLSEQGVAALRAAIDSGHASAHRGHVPARDELIAVLDVVEHLLTEIYVLSKHAERMRTKTPPRPRGQN